MNLASNREFESFNHEETVEINKSSSSVGMNRYDHQSKNIISGLNHSRFFKHLFFLQAFGPSNSTDCCEFEVPKLPAPFQKRKRPRTFIKITNETSVGERSVERFYWCFRSCDTFVCQRLQSVKCHPVSVLFKMFVVWVLKLEKSLLQSMRNIIRIYKGGLIFCEKVIQDYIRSIIMFCWRKERKEKRK